MTVFNGERFLRESIESVLQQTFTDFELIVINDGSIDATEKIILSFSDPRIKYFSVEHKGRGSALNYGLRMATSPVIGFFDADDIITPNRIALQYDVLLKDESIDVVSCWYYLIDERGNYGELKILPITHLEIYEAMPTYCSVCFTGTMLRRSVLTNTIYFDEDINAAIDYKMFMLLIDRAKFYNLPHVLVSKREVKGQISDTYNSEQMRNTYNISTRYLESKLIHAIDPEAKKNIEMKLALVEYCYGTKARSKRQFFQLIKKEPFALLPWRYFLASIWGDAVFSFLRKYNISKKIKSLLPAFIKRKLFLP
jgi:glycosyltransferase involved in cell wall biosynthesis